MDKAQIPKIIEWLENRVTLTPDKSKSGIRFDMPDKSDLEAARFDHEIINLTLDSDWWDDMVTDIVETPDFVEPDESPENILKFARDVVGEYIRKRIL